MFSLHIALCDWGSLLVKLLVTVAAGLVSVLRVTLLPLYHDVVSWEGVCSAGNLCRALVAGKGYIVNR